MSIISSLFNGLFSGLFATSWSGVTITGLIGSQLVIALAIAVFLVVRWYRGMCQKVKSIPTVEGAHWLLGHLPLLKSLVYDQGLNPSDGKTTEAIVNNDSNIYQ